MTDFSLTRSAFHIPHGITYLDGNSLGPLPLAAEKRAQEVIAGEWGEMLITAWNRAGWMEMPRRIGDRIARLIGAAPGTVVMGDTLSIKVYQALAAALDLRPDRKVVLSDSGNFPTDLYMAQGLLRSLGNGHELRVVAPEDVEAAIDEDVAALMLTHVDYRTGRMHDMEALTAKAHDAGALALWDLAHTAGAVPVDLAGMKADFATGCTYKYLNGGPGAPAFIYMRPDHAEEVQPALSGWLGHESPFAFDLGYRPGQGVERMRVGTPPVIQLAILDAALDVWDSVDMTDLRRRSIELTERFVAGVEANCPSLTLVGPRDPAKRGSQISFAFPQGYETMQALIARGVIGDFRAPDIMRFGFAPLYIGDDDVDRAVSVLADIIATRAYDNPEFRKRSAVT
jgi:kynureninase